MFFCLKIGYLSTCQIHPPIFLQRRNTIHIPIQKMTTAAATQATHDHQECWSQRCSLTSYDSIQLLPIFPKKDSLYWNVILRVPTSPQDALQHLCHGTRDCEQDAGFLEGKMYKDNDGKIIFRFDTDPCVPQKRPGAAVAVHLLH
jgi:hypothetical protein